QERARNNCCERKSLAKKRSPRHVSLLTWSEVVRFRIVRSFLPCKQYYCVTHNAFAQPKSVGGLAADFGRALAHFEADRLRAYRRSRTDPDRSKLVLMRVMIDFVCQMLQRSI